MREEIFEGIYIGIHWLWRETWRHTGTGTEPPIFLETPHPLHQCKEIRKSKTYLDFTLLVLFFYQTST